MTHTLRRRTLLTSIIAIALGAVLHGGVANAQSLTIDYSFGDLATGATTQAILPNSSYTVDIWAVITPASSTSDSNLGFTLAYFGAKSGTTSTLSILGGTKSATGGTNAGVGVSTVTPGSVFSTSANDSLNNGAGASASAAIGDWNDDGVNDLSSTTSKNSSLAIGTTSGNPIYGGTTSSTSEASGSTGWAFELGSFTVTTGATIGAVGSTTTFTPSVPTYNGSGEVDYTVNGGASFITANGNRITPGQAVTFDVASSNSSALALSPSSMTFNVLQGATSAPAQNLSLQETSGTSGNNATYTGTVPTGFSINNGASGTVNAGATNTLAVTYTGSTSTAGTFGSTNNYVVSNTSGSQATQGNLEATITTIVGNATDDTSGNNTFGGSILNASVANTASYAGLASMSNGGVKAPNSNSGQPGIEGSTATILMGWNNQGGTMTPTMSWRTRTLSETPVDDNVNGMGWPKGTPTILLPLISDVVNLYGMSSASTGANPGTTAPVPVDPFAFEIKFNPATLNAEGATGNAMASRGNLYLASLVPVNGTPTWENTILADGAVSGGTTATYQGQTIQIGSSAALAMTAANPRDITGANNFQYPALESFAAFAAANDITTAAQLANYVGDWGVDTSSNDEAWAIVDHNSEFAVVPEPTTIVLAAFGLLGGALALRRKKTLAAA